jgi:hypothetical protein
MPVVGVFCSSLGKSVILLKQEHPHYKLRRRDILQPFCALLETTSGRLDFIEETYQANSAVEVFCFSLRRSEILLKQEHSHYKLRRRDILLSFCAILETISGRLYFIEETFQPKPAVEVFCASLCRSVILPIQEHPHYKLRRRDILPPFWPFGKRPLESLI